MGLVHGRELLIRSIRSISIAILTAALACDGSNDATDAAGPDSLISADSLTFDRPDTTVTLVGTLPEGGPMPPPENAGGIPPYPGAGVHIPRDQTSEMRAFEAFTPDEWTRVVAWFDSQLGPPAWSRLQAEDMVIYEKGDDEAAITVSPWEGESLSSGTPAFMREARTAIGAAWRP